MMYLVDNGKGPRRAATRSPSAPRCLCSSANLRIQEIPRRAASHETIFVSRFGNDRRLSSSRVLFVLFNSVCRTKMMHCHPSSSIHVMNVTHARRDSRSGRKRLLAVLSILPRSHGTSTDHGSTSANNINKNSTSIERTAGTRIDRD